MDDARPPAPRTPDANTSGQPALLAIRLTWIILLLDPIGHVLVDWPVTAAAILGLALPRLVWHPALWWLASAGCALPVLADWTGVDNHAFLRLYWTLAISISASLDPKRAGACLAANARGLVGLTFLFALAWKAFLSPDFLDGSYLRFTFLTDSRFAQWSEWTSGLAIEDQRLNRTLVREWLASGEGAVWRRDFIEPSRLPQVARLSSLWTLAIEAAIAIGFLWPRRFSGGSWRHAALIVFAVTTYAVATVDAFGWLLCAMGLSQCEEERSRTRIAYLVTFFVILLYARAPWASWIGSVVG
jgi:hypothetical protein